MNLYRFADTCGCPMFCNRYPVEQELLSKPVEAISFLRYARKKIASFCRMLSDGSFIEFRIGERILGQFDQFSVLFFGAYPVF